MKTLCTANSFKWTAIHFFGKPQLFIFTALMLFVASCNKEHTRTVPISGDSVYAETGECDYPSQGADYALRMSGDLEGCLYAFIDDFQCAGDGNYSEQGRELFVGTYKGHPGTFRTTYTFEAKFEGCENGSYSGAEISGGCHHPIVEGSGTGIFKGVTGVMDFVDNVKTLHFPYTGYLKF